MVRSLVAASLLVGASAQLVAKTIAELEAEAALVPEPVAVEESKGFVHPTLCDPTVNQTAGYIDANPATPYFFWLFESKSDPKNDPLLMWLSGGPGCSSQLALFAENGPCTVDKGGKTTSTNPHSWHNNANVMWVDQPAGVGFSGGLGTHDEKGVARNMFTFLQGFFSKFPQYQQSAFYIFGESYAGHYVPAIAHKIWEGNKAGKHLHIPMKGIAIGNGLTNPEEQYKWYAEMGHTGGKDQGGHAPGVLNEATYLAMKAATPACVAEIAACNIDIIGVNKTTCMTAYETCNLMSEIPYELTGKNPYDMRIPCEHGSLCYDFDPITKYLNMHETKVALGVRTPSLWQSCNKAVTLLFVNAGDWMINFHTKIPDLLHNDIEVLIYAGDCDYICNWLGNKAWTKKLKWAGTKDFNAASDDDWQVGGETVARLRTAGNFHFMQVFNAGHMVPMDQPAVALEMVNSFTAGKLKEHTLTTSALVV